MTGRRLVAALAILALSACRRAPPAQYLLDFEDLDDATSRFATMGYLVVFNPGDHDAHASATFFFEDREPVVRPITIPARRNIVENFRNWPVTPKTRFAIRLESTEDLACQATIGWNNTDNDERPTAKSISARGPREAAKSYVAQRGTSREWWVADGIQIDGPRATWVRESETALLLNPNDGETAVTFEILGADGRSTRTVRVAGRRLKAVPMETIARKNVNYGVSLTSELPIAAHWRRDLFWYDSNELMSFWSVPAVLPRGEAR